MLTTYCVGSSSVLGNMLLAAVVSSMKTRKKEDEAESERWEGEAGTEQIQAGSMH